MTPSPARPVARLAATPVGPAFAGPGLSRTPLAAPACATSAPPSRRPGSRCLRRRCAGWPTAAPGRSRTSSCRPRPAPVHRPTVPGDHRLCPRCRATRPCSAASGGRPAPARHRRHGPARLRRQTPPAPGRACPASDRSPGCRSCAASMTARATAAPGRRCPAPGRRCRRRCRCGSRPPTRPCPTAARPRPSRCCWWRRAAAPRHPAAAHRRRCAPGRRRWCPRSRAAPARPGRCSRAPAHPSLWRV
ncbi:hypothetical protein FQZ97_498930 [compost metagenome]